MSYVCIEQWTLEIQFHKINFFTWRETEKAFGNPSQIQEDDKIHVSYETLPLATL